MRKLKNSFSSIALNQIYILYFRPVFEYSSIVGTIAQLNKPIHWKKCKMKPLGLLLDLTRSVPLENLHNDCGWDSLSLRRKSQKLKFMYKVTYNNVPSYISGTIPLTVGKFHVMNFAICKIYPPFLSELLYLPNHAFFHL